MIINIDSNFNKVLTIPLELADNCAEKYKYLHCKSLSYLLETEKIEEVYLNHDDNPTGIIISFKEPLRPNTFFKFSRKFNIEKFTTNDEYRANCQFYYWEYENKSSSIRFASPHLDIIESKELFTD